MTYLYTCANSIVVIMLLFLKNFPFRRKNTISLLSIGKIFTEYRYGIIFYCYYYNCSDNIPYRLSINGDNSNNSITRLPL